MKSPGLSAKGKKAHFVGIGGIGMSALAGLLLHEGWAISGCDLQESPLTRELARQGARVYPGHHPQHLEDAELVVITAAVHPDHVEVRAAQEQGIPVIKRAQLLADMMAGKRGIAVAGTHGKTTTTALLALTLTEAGLDPTALIGGEVPELGGNARRGAGPYLVAEADEFDGSFLSLRPEIAVVTNIEPEHLDYYQTFGGVVQAFGKFLQNVPPLGHIVYCLDDPVLWGLESRETILPKLNHKEPFEEVLVRGAFHAASFISYGFGPAARWRGERLGPNPLGGTDFLALRDGAPFADFSLRIPGRHNVSNALAVVATATVLGVEVGVLQQVFRSFGGVRRRFQLLGEVRGITVIDDYAHHPTEVRATLAAARARYGDRKLHCVFQPHTYSRTKLLMPLFAKAFQDADSVCITEIYAAREDNTWGVTGADLAASLQHGAVTFCPTLDQATEHQLRTLHPGDLLLVMGAGDVYHVGAKVLEELKKADHVP